MKAESFPAVILAAGAGRRMKADMPKPLVKLLGLTMLERTIMGCREAGIEKFYVVVGYEKEKVIKHVEEIRKKHGVDVEVIENKNWKKGNGTSVLAALQHLSTPFFVLMCDHIFDVEIIKNFVKDVAKEKHCVLGIDKKIERVHDIDEATKVKLRGKFIEDIGKELKNFDAVDTGIFFFHPYAKEAMKKAVEEGDASLIQGVKNLAREKKIKGIEVKGEYWIDADTQENLRVAENLLLKSLIKPQDGVISKYINRKISLLISKRLCNTPITPNAISFISFLLSIIAAFLFLMTDYIYLALAGIITQASSVIDGCDGEIARLKFQSSPFGAWLDTVLDRYADVAIAGTISYTYSSIYGNAVAWIIGVLAISGFILSSYSRKEYVIRYGKELPTSKIEYFGRRDFRLFIIFIGAILAYPLEALAVTATLHHIVIIALFFKGRNCR